MGRPERLLEVQEGGGEGWVHSVAMRWGWGCRGVVCRWLGRHSPWQKARREGTCSLGGGERPEREGGLLALSPSPYPPPPCPLHPLHPMPPKYRQRCCPSVQIRAGAGMRGVALVGSSVKH